VALALLAGAHCRPLRDAWRVQRVRARPEYRELRTRWRRIAKATEELCWPDDGTRRKRPRGAGTVSELKLRPGWEGPEAFMKELTALTARAEERAYWDFGPQWADATGHGWESGEKAFRELLAMRARGELSPGTFSRAMLILARHGDCFLHEYTDPGALRVGLRIFCELVGDGGPPVPRAPAANLGEAIEDAARSRCAARLCELWKRNASSGAHSGMARAVAKRLVLREVSLLEPVYEPEAYKVLGQLTRRNAWASFSDLRYKPPRWPVKWSDRRPADLPRIIGSGPEYRPFCETAADEARRLPAGLQGAFCSVMRLIRNCDADGEIRHEFQESARRGGRAIPSPTLRLIAEIIRNWE